MLVLSRKANQKIMIGDNIVVVVLDILSGGIVKLGVKAPRDVAVYREELYQEISQANHHAAAPANLPEHLPKVPTPHVIS